MDGERLEAPFQLRPHISHHSSRLQQVVSDIDEYDASSRYREEEGDNKVTNSKEQHPSSSTLEQRIIVSWDPDDRENPYNWSNIRKTYILVLTMLAVLNSTIASSLPSNAVAFISDEWGPFSQAQRVLPISMFLLGYIFGPIFWAPLSEQVGRRLLTLGGFGIYTIFTLACAVAPNWPAFLVFRLFVGMSASSPIATATGICADIYGDYQTRGRAISIYMVATAFGPLISPVISGFCSSYIGWRWSFWIALIAAGVTFILLFFLPETYGPILLLRRAKHIRKTNPQANVVAPHEIEKQDVRELVVRVLTRPLRMLFFELIVTTSSLYLALVYTIFYSTFQAFPIIYEGVYGLSPGVCGLMFLSVGGGILVTLPIFWAYDRYLERAKNRKARWTRQEEFRRVPLACLGGPLFVISLFWLGWTSREDVPFVVPMLSGIPFGMGFMLIFMALLNYLTDAYEIFAASANAAASCCRSTLATVLPFACYSMFQHLGIPGACSLLAGLSCVMCIIPFIFLWKGETIRARSKFCIALRERKVEMARKVEEQRRKQLEQVGGQGSSGSTQILKDEAV